MSRGGRVYPEGFVLGRLEVAARHQRARTSPFFNKLDVVDREGICASLFGTRRLDDQVDYAAPRPQRETIEVL